MRMIVDGVKKYVKKDVFVRNGKKVFDSLVQGKEEAQLYGWGEKPEQIITLNLF